MLNARKKITLIGIISAIMVSAFGIGIASAQDDPQPMPPVAEERSNPVRDYISELGLTVEDLNAAAEAGLTWREFIESNGGNVADLEALMTSRASERLNTMLDNTVRAPQGRIAGRMGEGFGNLQELADITGIDLETLREGLQNGSSLADIVTSNGADLQTVIDTIVANRTETLTVRLDEAVANGRITQEQADERLASLSENVTTFLNSTPEELRQNMRDGMRNRFDNRRDNRRDGRGGPGGLPGFGAPNNDVPAESTPDNNS